MICVVNPIDITVWTSPLMSYRDVPSHVNTITHHRMFLQ